MPNVARPDAAPVHVHDLQIEAIPLGLIANRGDMAKPVEDQPGDCAESTTFPRFIGTDFQLIDHVGDAHGSVE